MLETIPEKTKTQFSKEEQKPENDFSQKKGCRRKHGVGQEI